MDESATVTPTLAVDTPSTNEAELNAKIDQELGLPPLPTTEEKPDEVPAPPTETPETPDAEPSEPASEEDTPEAEPEADEEVVPSEPATPSDPELSIEVVDAEGVTHKISTLDDLPDDFTPKNNIETLRIVAELSKLDAERERRTAVAETAAQEALVKETQTAQFKSWDSEIAELAKTDRVDIKDTDRINNVFGYMNEINAARAKAGNPNLVTSYEDALEKFEAKEARDKVETDKKNGNDIAKTKSGIIGRSSASAGGDKYVYRAGSARSIDDIPV